MQSTADPCVFIKVEGTLTVVAVYDDDLILITITTKDMRKLKTSLESRFEMKDLSALHYCFGINAIQDKEKGCVWIHQKQYIQRMLQKYGPEDANPSEQKGRPIDLSVHCE